MILYSDNRWIGDHGIGRFARELLSRVDHLPVQVAGRPSDPADPFRLAWALRRMGKRAMFFSPGYNAPIGSPCPFVFSIHDLNHIDRDENSSLLKRIYYDRIMRPACARAAFVFTVSEFSRDRIIEWAAIPEWKVINVGNGVNSCFAPSGSVHESESSYYLCVSNRRPHKNEPRLLAAFAAARVSPDSRLLMTGPPTVGLNDLIQTLGLRDRVQFVGRVTDESLSVLYRGAVATLFPSLYEGFGLPVVESMACGTPVLTSSTTALAELAGGAALLINPESVESIANGIEQLDRDATLRKSLVDAGTVRAKQFSWDAVARRARAAFDQVELGPTAPTAFGVVP